MVVLGFVVFSLPCLRFSCLAARGYQRRRFAVKPEEEVRTPTLAQLRTCCVVELIGLQTAAKKRCC
jgi:hypothetical protein